MSGVVLRFPAQTRELIGAGLFPVAPVERRDRERDRLRVEAAHVDAVAVRVRARNIERFDAAGLAERVPGDAGIEGVNAQIFRSLEQLESGARYDEVQVARFRADRTVALAHLDVLGRFHFEPNRAAVAASGVFHNGYMAGPSPRYYNGLYSARGGRPTVKRNQRAAESVTTGS